jgi:hypothetical protein
MTAVAEPADRPATSVNYAAKLTRPHFAEFLGRLNRRDDLVCTIEIAGDRVGGTEGRALPLRAVTVEDGDDQIAIVLDGLTHYVKRPRTIEVVGRDETPHRIVIAGADGARTTLRFA